MHAHGLSCLKHACCSHCPCAPQKSGDEVLYVRPDAVFDKSKPISGGVPHCFPQVRRAGTCAR